MSIVKDEMDKEIAYMLHLWFCDKRTLPMDNDEGLPFNPMRYKVRLE